ncbi:MAG: hypothetical protein Fur0041_12990 [Bacteroidia bacterium]
MLLVSCSKTDPEQRVTFSVRELSPEAPTYTITWTSDKSGGSTVSSASSDAWTSPSAMLPSGQNISLRTECNAPVYDLMLYIYINGNLMDTKALRQPEQSATLSVTIP